VTRHLSFIPGLAGATVEEGIMTGNLPAHDEKISSKKKLIWKVLSTLSPKQYKLSSKALLLFAAFF
jgi:hypothetical protein